MAKIKQKSLYQNYDYAPKHKKKKNKCLDGQKAVENLKINLESTKTKITDEKNMMKVVL